MTTRQARLLSEAVAEAVLGVPGVACLRPGLRGLLRASVTGPAGAAGGGTAGASVFVSVDAGGTVSGVRVDVVVRERHQAARTARAVRAAAAVAAAAPPEVVRVNVTGIV
ncbi:Asp23/Gls24 family envelope stress response protein [Streptomyces sp. NPDC004435]|uniref:Asp23/Gls24 family envelope stress response protein n=1 Tax=Streptomyces sp. NPDC004435 TaxID=3364701 RepID=UPI00369D7D46